MSKYQVGDYVFVVSVPDWESPVDSGVVTDLTGDGFYELDGDSTYLYPEAYLVAGVPPKALKHGWVQLPKGMVR